MRTKSFLLCLLLLSFSTEVISQVAVAGTVLGAKGPLVEARVAIKDSSHISTTTDKNGNFLLAPVSKNPILVISSLGYITKELQVQNENIVTIRLEKKAEVEDEDTFLPGSGAEETVETKFATVEVLFATDRNLKKGKELDEMFGIERAGITYGQCAISIPRDHRMGELEEASVLSFETKNDPEKHVTLLEVNVRSKEDFFTALKERVNGAKEKKAFVFVHGYNVSFADAARRTGQMAYDLGFDGAPVFYSWPSQESLFGYNVDQGNIEWSAGNMVNFLRDFLQNSDAQNIYLIAHSMGNRGLSKALATLIKENPELTKNIKEIILAAPDIDADIFKQQIAPVLVESEKPITLYTSSKDIPLLASKLFSNHARAGQAGEDIVLIPGIETIDASSVKSDFLGHSYFGESMDILSDMFQIINRGLRPKERFALRPVITKGNTYWRFKG